MKTKIQKGLENNSVPWKAWKCSYLGFWRLDNNNKDEWIGNFLFFLLNLNIGKMTAKEKDNMKLSI